MTLSKPITAVPTGWIHRHPCWRTLTRSQNCPWTQHPPWKAISSFRETTEGRQFVANPYYFMVDTAGHQLPYINEMDEIFVGESEVRLLKLVNGEVDYKAQALQADYVPLLLENQEKAGFVVDLKPESRCRPLHSTSRLKTLKSAKCLVICKFRQAMSVAMNRDEINEVAMFGSWTPQQYIGSRRPPLSSLLNGSSISPSLIRNGKVPAGRNWCR